MRPAASRVSSCTAGRVLRAQRGEQLARPRRCRDARAAARARDRRRRGRGRDAGRATPAARERREQQRDHFAVAVDARLAEELGADLDRPRASSPGAAGSCAARCPRSTGASRRGSFSRCASMRATCGVMSARTPSRRPDSGSTTLNVCSSRSRPRAGQQRIEMLDQRRLHQAIAVRAKVVEQRAAQRLEPRRPRPAARPRSPRAGASYACCERAAAPTSAEPRSTIEADEAELPVGELGQLAETYRATGAARRTAAGLRGSARSASADPQRIRHAVRPSRGAATSAAACAARGRAPYCLKYWKNSALGSSTIRSLCCGTSPCTPRGCGRTRRTRDSGRTRARRSPTPSRRLRP